MTIICKQFIYVSILMKNLLQYDKLKKNKLWLLLCIINFCLFKFDIKDINIFNMFTRQKLISTKCTVQGYSHMMRCVIGCVPTFTGSTENIVTYTIDFQYWQWIPECSHNCDVIRNREGKTVNILIIKWHNDSKIEKQSG